MVNPAIFKMTHFNPEEFMFKPSQETFDSLIKDDLISLGKHLTLDVKKATRKDQIQHIIMKHLVSLKTFQASALESMGTSDTELRKLELELELKKLEMQKERELKEQKFRERELQDRKKERELV